MRKITHYVTSCLALLLAVSTLTITPVFAHPVHDHDEDDDTSMSTMQEDEAETTSADDNSGSTGDSSDNNKSENRRGLRDRMVKSSSIAVGEPDPNGSGDSGKRLSRDELRQKGKDLVAELKKERGGKSAGELKKICTERKGNIDNRTTKISNTGKRLQQRVDTIFTKAKAYQQSKSLDAPEINALKAAAESEKTLATAAVGDLQALQPSINCAATDNADKLAAYKASAQTTKAALKDYKAAVKAYLLALKAATIQTKTTENQ